MVHKYYEEAINRWNATACERLLTVAEEDKVVAHQKWIGTHEGEFLGIPPTSRKVTFTSTAILLIHQGLIAQAWDEVDLLGIQTQLTED